MTAQKTVAQYTTIYLVFLEIGRIWQKFAFNICSRYLSNQLHLYGLGSVTFIGQRPRPKLTNPNANMLLRVI